MTQKNGSRQKHLSLGSVVGRGLCAVLLGIGVSGCKLEESHSAVISTGSCEQMNRQNIDAIHQLYVDFENATGSHVEVTNHLGIVGKKEFDFHWGALTAINEMSDTRAASVMSNIRRINAATSCNAYLETRMMHEYILLREEYKRQFDERRMISPGSIKYRI